MAGEHPIQTTPVISGPSIRRDDRDQFSWPTGV
jgi:hypothetical protein